MRIDSKPGRTYGGKDPAERSFERRARLVAAGMQLFGTHGYSATTVRHVCTEAGLTERYFYESFENREQLFVAVATECVTGLVAVLVDARTKAKDEPIPQVDAMLGAFFRWFEEDPRRARIQLFEPLLISPAFQTFYRDVTSLFVAMIADIATRWFGPRLAEERLDATLIATGLVGAAIEMVKDWSIGGYSRPMDEMIRNTSFLFTSLAGRYPAEHGSLA